MADDKHPDWQAAIADLLVRVQALEERVRALENHGVPPKPRAADEPPEIPPGG